MPCPCQCNLGIVEILRGNPQCEELLSSIELCSSSHSLAEGASHPTSDTVCTSARSLLVLAYAVVGVYSELEAEVGPAQLLEEKTVGCNPGSLQCGMPDLTGLSYH